MTRLAATSFLSLVAFAGCGGSSDDKDTRAEATSVRRAMTGFIYLFAKHPDEACERFLTAAARRQQTTAVGPGCETHDGVDYVDPYRLRVRITRPGREALAYYAITDTGVCHPRSTRAPQRTDHLVKTDQGWKIDHFGFGRIRCVAAASRPGEAKARGFRVSDFPRGGKLYPTPRQPASQRAKPGLIVAQRSIDRLSLGMTPATVRYLFGDPERVERDSQSGTGKPVSHWVYGERGLTAIFRQVKQTRFTLAGISTTSKRHRTRSGVGVGSSERVLRERIGDIECGPTNPPMRECFIGSGKVGSRQTVFVLPRGRVSEVRVLITW